MTRDLVARCVETIQLSPRGTTAKPEAIEVGTALLVPPHATVTERAIVGLITRPRTLTRHENADPTSVSFTKPVWLLCV